MGIPTTQRPLIIAIVGGSGSGKTWLARKLKRFLGRRAGLLSLDDIYRDLAAVPMAERRRVNFDHPKASGLSNRNGVGPRGWSPPL